MNRFLKLNDIFKNRQQPVARPRFLLLPGFGNDQIDYVNPLKQGTDLGFATQLRRRGYEVEVVPIARTDWLKIALALGTKEFYSSTCRPEQLFNFYFRSTDKVLQSMMEQDDSQPVILCGHSAGGWLARAMLNDGSWLGSSSTPSSSSLVAGLVTLGSPHLSPAVGAEDMTRGALKYVQDTFPGAFLSSPKDATAEEKIKDMFYISVAGTAVPADEFADKETVSKFAYGSYAQVTGVKEQGALGDGVVPFSHAHLDGAEQISLDCYHSIQSDRWYGSDSVIDRWLPQTVAAYERTIQLRNKSKRLQREQ